MEGELGVKEEKGIGKAFQAEEIAGKSIAVLRNEDRHVQWAQRERGAPRR